MLKELPLNDMFHRKAVKIIANYKKTMQENKGTFQN
jgi:hypothetical protein